MATSVEYNKYLQSNEWKQVSSFVMELDDYVCACCGGGGELAVHHTTYKNIGKEIPYKLITLCRKCHYELHKTGFIDRDTMRLFDTTELMKTLELISPTKGKVMSLLIREFDRDNKLVITTSQIAEKTGFSQHSVVTFLKELSEADIIARKRCFIMVNPKFVHKGGESNKNRLMKEYAKFKGETE